MNWYLYALTGPSLWPLLCGLSLAGLLGGNVFWFYRHSFRLVLLGLISLVVLSFLWTQDLARESNYLGKHAQSSQIRFKLGMLLFIFSEVIFFFRFFWTFLHFRLNPIGDIGLSWPPNSVCPLDPFRVPLLNTFILVSSGRTLTLSHHYLLGGYLNSRKIWLILTLILAVAFTLCQGFEYFQAFYRIRMSNYGRIFFLSTGFHGSHVLAGTNLLLISLIKLFRSNYNGWHHIRFETAAWYWHFVDVVWLGLFSLVYWWAA